MANLGVGSGKYLRQNGRRLDSVAVDSPRVEKLLAEAVEVSQHDPTGVRGAAAGSRNEIRSLGPSFFTKFLYFAGGGALGSPVPHP
ncbi:8-oxoguanine DNA glycosylase OGG fold protein [Kibdelosporangium aridum]|uniref:8-oxoguanine DNA glycosylase OGG fold protein n=1 Tax=Kibdelosporangium aridum TaxID=2030 RepID=UPI002E113F47